MRLARLAVVAACLLALACGYKRPEARKDDPRGAASALAPGALPTVTESSTGQIYTWIDAKGDFATAESTKEVPLVGRDVVRVQDPGKEEPDDTVFVTDLRNTRSDGTYPVRAVTRRELDDLAEARRKTAGRRTLAHAEDRPAAPDPSEHAAPEASVAADVAPRSAVIIYGASWCGPCHQAQDYLKKKGVRFVMKDIDEDSSAQREMTIKLAKVGARNAGIPVIDVRGKILVGFNPAQLDAALAARPDPPL